MIVSGALNDNEAAPGTGTAYVFRLDRNGTPNDPTDDTWFHQAKLTAAPPLSGAHFGTSVAVDDGIILVGAPEDDGPGDTLGAVYAYALDDGGTPEDPSDDDWTQEARLIPWGEPDGNGHFGSTLAFDSGRAAIGAYGDIPDDQCCGAVYTFQREGEQWIQGVKLTGNGRHPTYFAWSVGLSGELAVVGAPGHDGACPGELDCDSGAAYVFAVAGDCNHNDAIDVCEILDEPQLDKDEDGLLDQCEIVVVSSEPTDGAIDARQPSEPDGTNPAGWQSIQIVFDGNAEFLTVADIEVTVDPPGPPPSCQRLLASAPRPNWFR